MTVFERIKDEIDSIRRQRYQFLLIKCHQNKEKDLHNVFIHLGIPSINVNIELASRLRDIPITKRSRLVRDELFSVVNQIDNDVIFLNRIQYLFDPELNQNPIGLIEFLSGNKVILVNWPGEIKEGALFYGTPNHPEYFHIDGYEDHVIKL
jgi:hypothetical protein